MLQTAAEDYRKQERYVPSLNEFGHHGHLVQEVTEDKESRLLTMVFFITTFQNGERAYTTYCMLIILKRHISQALDC